VLRSSDAKPLSSDSLNYSHDQEKKSRDESQEGCQLICDYQPQTGWDLWYCDNKNQNQENKTSNCAVITRKIMRNLQTTDPKIPTLLNYTSETFWIGFYPDMGIKELEDGFLMDFPQVNSMIRRKMLKKSFTKQ
jgi:hypothetical protein